MAMTYDEFQRRRKAGETVQDLANETNASKPPETYSVPYGTLTYDEFKNARQAGVRLDDLVEVGKTKPAPSVYQTRAADYAQRVMDTEAENNWGKPDTRTTLQKATDKLLGVDRTKVTGGKTDWGKLAEGAAVKGANQANAGFWSGVGIFNDIGKKITNSKVGNWLFGDLADGANAIATTTINGAIDTINSIFGTNYAEIKNGQSALDFLVSDAQAGKANAEAKYEKNANTSRAAQIIDQFGTSTVAAIPMAIEAAILAPTQAAQAAQVTTSGLSYFSGLQNAKGVEAVGMMGREGLNKLFRNPQFWTSYLQAAGDGYESAKEDGMSQDDAAVYALTNGFFNAMVEVGGADEALGGIQNLPMRLRQAAESGNKSAVVNWFKDSVLGEAWEEVQQGAIERGTKSFFGQDVPIFSMDPTDDRAIINPYTAGQEFLGGAVVGGLLGGGQVAVNSAVQGISDSRTFKGDAQALIKAAKNSAQEADQASIAQIESAMAARKGNTITMGEARTLQEIASRTGNMHTYVQNILQAENQQRAEQQREATQQSRVSRYLERVRAGEVDQTGTADTKGATIQYEGRQAKVDFVRDGDQNRVRLTFDDGTERTVSYQEAADAGLDENVRNLMVALSAIGPNAPAAYSVYESDQEVGRYAAAMDEAINLYAAQGQDVRKAAAAARESNSPAMITYLTDAQLELAQSLGSKIYEQKQTQVKEAGAKLAEIRQAAQETMSAQNVTATEGLAAVNATLTDARQHLKNVQQAFNDTMEYLDEMAANGQEGTEAYQNALEQANALRDDLDGTQKVIEALEDERKNLQDRQPIKRKQGTVSFAGGTINGEKVNGVDRSKLNRQQKNVVAMVEALADAVNVDYVFFDGDARGNQGAYVQGGTVYININAGMAANKALAAATLSHELTHYMQEYAPEEHEQLKQFIISNALQKGELDRLVQQQLRLEPNLSYDQALDEVVANACQTMLQDSKAIAKLARQNMTLAEKIADYIDDITARLKAAFEDVNYQDNLPLYNAVKAMEEQLDEMKRLWDAGIEAATENYNAQNTVRNARGQAENAQETQNVPENAEEMPAAAQRADTQNQQWDEMTDEERQAEINASMTMQQAKTMVEKAYTVGGIREWYGDEYRNAEQWLQAVGSSEVSDYIENDYELQRRYINSNPHLVDYDFTIAEVLDAYLAGTLTGKRERAARGKVDTSRSTGYRDSRFYAPNFGKADAETWALANSRMTKSNTAQVNEARKNILLAAHEGNITETLGITQKELNQKLRNWSRYPASTRELSMRINRGVAPENQWTGLQNASFLSQVNMTDDDIRSMVRSVNGESTEYQRNYIGRAMLALDTHIDWSEIAFDFVRQADPDRRSVRGLYNNSERKITVGASGAQNTVSHEMGHALDYRWERDLFGERWGNTPLSQTALVDSLIADDEGRNFYHNYRNFIDSLMDVNDNVSKYTMEPTEIFARFVAKFVEWTYDTAGAPTYHEDHFYEDKFNTSHYMEFARLLQEKAAWDAKHATETAQTRFQAWDGEEDFREKISALSTDELYQMSRERSEEIKSLREQIQTFEDQEDSWDKRLAKNEVTVDEYADWLTSSGLNDLYNRQNQARKEYGVINDVAEKKHLQQRETEERAAIEKSGVSEEEYFVKQAVKEFGYTPYFYDAGYIVPNGKMLNFSGEKGKHFGSRGQDHRAIGTIFANSSGSDAMIRFINMGNIRIMPESPGFDISSQHEPTAEQYRQLRSFIRQNMDEDYLAVDITGPDGYSVANLEYEGTIRPDRVINDIKHYYQTGEVREQGLSTFFQRWDSGQTNLFGDETAEQISLDDWVNNRQETSRDLHPRLQKMLDDAAALEERVREFFRSVPEDSQYYLDSDQIDSMMEVDLYGSDGDMHGADDIVDSISNLAKNMRGSNRENAYELMDALLQHLSVVQQDRWIEQPSFDSAFFDWYSRKHPSLYYPGYEMGKLDLGKEVNYLRELIDSGTLTAEDQAEAQRLYDAMTAPHSYNFYQKWDDIEDDTATEAEQRKTSYARIKAENATLKETIEGLNAAIAKQKTTIGKIQERLKLTKTPEVRQGDANRLARQLVKDHSSTADAARVAAELKALGDYILQNTEIDADVVKQRARAIAAEIVQNAETTVDYGGELAMYRNITSDIKGKKLTIDEDFLGELDAVDGYDAFRKRNFANFTLAKRETGDSAGREGYSTVGGYYKTLQQQYGEAYFPEVANEGEQIQVIADMFQRAKGITVNPNEDYMGEATEELANRIAFDVMDGIMRPTPPTQADRQKARTDALRQQIKDLQKEGALSEKEADMLRKTIYDLTLALDNAESRYKTLQVTSDERFRQIQAEGKERAVEAKLRERARQEEKIAALKDHYQEMADRARDRRENTHTRHKIRKLVDRLNKMLKSPTEKRHIPRELVKETIAVLEMIDLDTGRSANITAQLAKIRQMYEGYKNNPTYAVGYDETVDEMLSNLQQTIGETPLHKMTAEQLEAVYSTLRALNHVISTAVQVQIGEQERNAFELAESMTAETRDIPKAQKGWLRSHYLPAHLRADVMFNRLGGHKKNSVWSQIARMLNDGQLKQTMIKMQLSTQFASLVNDERALQDFTGTDKRGRIDQKKLVDIGLKDKDGNTIKVTHGIMVGIYMDLLNEQNRRHLIRGGKTIPNLNDYYSGKGGFGTGTVRAVGIATELSDLYHQMNEAKEDGDTDLVQELEDRIEEVQLSGETYADTMQESIEKQMTAFDRKWVAAIQQLMDVDSKAFLNATTMEVYGIEKASVDNYYPITSDPDFLSTPFESITKDMNLENVGFMKERVLNASNPTLAMDVSDVVNNQINRVAQYCGLMPAIRNFNKVYNKTEGGYNDSLKNAINDVFGKEGKKYIENLMADLTGSRRSSEDSLGLSRILGGLRGNLAQTTLTLNPRVALAQAASYPTAAAELGWGPLVRAFAHGGKNGRMISRADAQLIAEYSPLLWYRMQGYSQQELADATNRNDYAGRLWKKMRWATGWIQAVDGATVGRLWYAAEYWVDANKPDLKKGTDAYYQEVAKKFNDVVEKTQPNYTTMQRADVLRSPSDLVKTLTMFMTQRLQNFNIIYDSTAGYQKARADFVSGRNGVTATDVKEAKTQMVQAVTSQLAQAAVFTAFKMFADALLHNMNGYRDDETGDLTPESVAMQLLRNYIDALVGAAIFGSEIYSLIKVFTAGDSWYGLSVNGVDSVNDLVDDTVNLMKTDVDTSTEKGRAKLGNNILKAAQSWAQLLGAPLRNAIKMVSSVRYHIEDIKNGEFLSFEAGYERTKKQIAFKENIQPVGISGKQYEKILKRMNMDKSGSVSQAEAYTYLSEEYAKGKLSKEQVEGIWNAQGWSKAYDEYAETAEKAAAKEAEQNRNLEAAGVTPEQYEAMKAEMNTDGNSSVTQEEAGKYLQDQVNGGNLTEAQADALWKVVGPTWKKTYGQWQGNETEPTTTQTVRPAPTPESVKITTYDQFKSAAHIYSDKRETAYNLWESSVQPLGIDLDRYTQYINVSDVNDNGSVTQEELGATLTEAISRGELNGDQAEAIWHTLWNGGRSKTYASWAAKNATRGGMPSQEELLELNENPDRYDVGDTTVTAAEILAETLDRGQTIAKVGETYQLIPGEYPSRKLYGEWLPVLEELGIDPSDVWENGQNVTLSQMSQYYTPEEYRERIEYMRQNRWWIDLGFEEEPTYAANELYLGWQENPDYPGQTFEEYLNTPESQSWLQQLAQTQSEAAGGEWDRFTGGTARTYRGTGQKARRSGEALYVSRAMRDSKRGRR